VNPETMRRLGFDDPQDPFIGRVQYLENADTSLLNTISCGIVFVMAWWSGGARTAWAQLKAVVRNLDPSGLIQITVVDTDGLTGLDDGGGGVAWGTAPLGGWGETIWVVNGQPTATANYHDRDERFVPNTLQLLNRCKK
jgi:hypothetical protein